MKSNVTLFTAVALLLVGTGLSLAQTTPVPAAPPTPVVAAAAVATPAPDPFETPQMAYVTSFGGQGFEGMSGPGRTLVIPNDAADAKNLGEVEEDLSVMARIL